MILRRQATHLTALISQTYLRIAILDVPSANMMLMPMHGSIFMNGAVTEALNTPSPSHTARASSRLVGDAAPLRTLPSQFLRITLTSGAKLAALLVAHPGALGICCQDEGNVDRVLCSDRHSIEAEAIGCVEHCKQTWCEVNVL
jgi:hypothetical protein